MALVDRLGNRGAKGLPRTSRLRKDSAGTPSSALDVPSSALSYVLVTSPEFGSWKDVVAPGMGFWSQLHCHLPLWPSASFFPLCASVSSVKCV